MNNVVQYVSYGYYGRNSGSGFSCNSGASDDRNIDDDDNDNNKYDDMRKKICWLR